MSATDSPRIVGTYFFLQVHSVEATTVWQVLTHDRILLGWIRWHGAWRCYAFFPSTQAIFESTCLHEIAVACQMATTAYRKRKKNLLSRLRTERRRGAAAARSKVEMVL